MANFLISPAEPPAIRTMGQTSSVPERYGADVMWLDKQVKGVIGVQRKEMNDLINSVRDGRLAKEVGQFKQCGLAILIIEGQPRWTSSGELLHKYARWTRAQHRSLIRSTQLRGIIVEQSDDMADTMALLLSIAAWVAKGAHRSLDRRPGPETDEWGKRGSRAWASHLLQSVPLIGPGQAESILDHFGGPPIGLTVTRAQLLEVKGLGKKRVDAIERAFSQEGLRATTEGR